MQRKQRDVGPGAEGVGVCVGGGDWGGGGDRRASSWLGSFVYKFCSNSYLQFLWVYT